jgi:hypothetical protein
MSNGLAWVTGASSGIGEAFARRLAADGYDLVLVARREDRLRALAEELGAPGRRIDVLAADLAVDADLRAVEQRVAGEADLTLLVNNAGFAHFGPFEAESADAAEASLRVMVLATVRLTKAALAGFRARGAGDVINVSSRAAFGAQANLATYGAAKAYVNRFTLALASELGGTGIRMLAVCPGNVWTELFERAGVDPATIRSALQPAEVVEAALAALAAGEVVCVPGERGRDRFLRRLVPARLLERAAGVLARLSGA